MSRVALVPGCRSSPAAEVGDRLVITARTRGRWKPCPDCGVRSSRVHSYYQRRAGDLPVNGERVELLIQARRFRCLNPRCSRRTFVEDLPNLLPRHARRTIRLQGAQAAVGVALGGEASARLLPELGMPVSADTALRDVRRVPLVARPPPRVLGVDDWALRRGRTYGTILVDLERHVVVDLLPDRTSATLAAWLSQHPGVEVIARDRSTEYAKGASQGAPDAVQVADRWHLLQSARQLLERYLPGVHARLRELPEPPTRAEPAWARQHAFPRTRSEAVIGQKAREERHLVYERVKELRHQGLGIATIARKLRINRQTVRKYAYAHSFPERGRQAVRESQLDPFLPYLHAQWEAGCENASQLWREIQERGYTGTKKQVLRWMSTRRRTPSKHSPQKTGADAEPLTAAEPTSPASRPLPGPKRLAWLLCQGDTELAAAEGATVARVRQDSELTAVHDAITAFIGLVRTKTSEGFDAWLETTTISTIRALRTFARGIQADYAAVRAALELPWSNAQCEGQVTRLKFLKRQMYGRANFDLLRQRILLTA